MKTDAEILGGIWLRVTGRNFSANDLADLVILDGGYDISNISREDIICLVCGRFDGSWSEVGFSFSKLLAYYAAYDGGICEGHVVAWAFSAFVISDSIQLGAAEWEFNYRNLMKGFGRVCDVLEDQECIEILRRVFGKSGNQ